MAAINEIARIWWQWMGPMLWQASLLIAVVAGLDYLIRGWAWPQVRHALWILVLAKLVIPPTWALSTSVFSHMQPRIRRVLSQQLTGTGPNRTIPQIRDLPYQVPEQIGVGQPAETDGAGAAVSDQQNVKPSWQVYAMGMWLLGIGLFLGLLITKMRQLGNWHRQQASRTIPQWFHELLVETSQKIDLQKLPAIVFSAQAVTPAVYGMFRPVLLLPAGYFDNLSRDEAEHVLLHELAHLKRGDLWLHGFCLLLQIVYWFNPLMILVRKQMKHVREICCDLTVARILKENTMNYRQTLLNTARELLTESPEPGLGIMGVFDEPFRLVPRLKWLEKKTWKKHRLMRVTALCVGLILGVCILPMSGLVAEETPLPAESEGKIQAQRSSETGSQSVSGLDEVDFRLHVKDVESMYAAVLPMVGSYEQFDVALSRCGRLLAEAGVEPTGPPFARFFTEPHKVPEARLAWEIGYPVTQGTTVEPPLEVLRVAERRIASLTVFDIEDTGLLWPLFIKMITDQGLIPAFPPAMEIFHGASSGRDPWLVTEMQLQVIRPDDEAPRIEVALADAFSAVVLPMRGSFSQLPGAVEMLRSFLVDAGMEPAGDPFGRYLSDPGKTLPEENLWEVGIPVMEAARIRAPYEFRQFQGGMVASWVFSGHRDAEHPWAPFITRLVLNGFFPAGPAMEIWSGDGGSSRIELKIPILRMEDFGEWIK